MIKRIQYHMQYNLSLSKHKARFQPDFHLSHCRSCLFLVLKSYLPILTYRIYHCLYFLACSLVTDFMPLLCWNPEMALALPFHYPGYEQFVCIIFTTPTCLCTTNVPMQASKRRMFQYSTAIRMHTEKVITN